MTTVQTPVADAGAALGPQGGWLVIDKPCGPSSHDVVAMVRRTLKTRAVGHTGTLDPFASGVLVVLAGQLTRLADALSGCDKRYHATVLLGVQTDTDDHTGQVVASADPSSVTSAALGQAVAALSGPQMQVPPGFSAKHVDGKRAYQLARQGSAPQLPPVPVTLHQVTVVHVQGPRVELDVWCSKGTYIRALARDLGFALGVGGHLVALRRAAVGGISEAMAVTLDALTPDAVRPPPGLLAFVPHATLPPDQARRVAMGQQPLDATVGRLHWPAGSLGALTCQQRLVALAVPPVSLEAGQQVGPGGLAAGRRFPEAG